ncbi:MULTISPECIES: ATP-binding protein [Peptoniphilus]|uniref:ATP-binding protein n=1 Tax=Peptoniphilus TaxID=162289 RepID=UPI0001DA9DE8|nr:MULTISPECIES: ATP-binding protein [Peptoniphilus]EFI41451.1 hypothetical protein HMPREF0629_00070 [Peptoniphilus sp. oral taxon 386 str. F0131]
MSALYRFNGSICSDLDELRIFLEDILYSLKKYICDEETIYDIRLILDELMVNGVLHGNKKDKCKCVCLEIVLHSDSITIRVSDEGCGVKFDFDSYDYNSLKCSGRGLILVRALTDDLVFNKNEIIVTKRVSL